MMQSDADFQMQNAIQHLQHIFEESKKQKNDQIKVWQDRVEALEQQLAMMQTNMQKLETEKVRIETDYNNATIQIESLKSQNQVLMQALQEKDEQLNKFVSLNQNLKDLIDQTSYIPTETKIPNFSFNPENFTSKPNSYNPPTKTNTTQTISSMVSQQIPSKPYNREDYSTFQKTSTRQSTSAPTARRTASKSSLFIKAAKEELSSSDFNHMISEINLYNKKSQSREETIANVKRLLGSAHRGLFEQFLPMVSGV